MSKKDFYVHRYCRQREVTGSSFFYSVHWPDGENIRFFVDAGAFQGGDNNSYLNGFFPFKAEKLSFGIITHLHFDHVGLLPVIVRQGFKGKIYTSYGTANLLDVALADTTTIEDKQLGRTIATIEEVQKTLAHTVGCAYKKIIRPHKNIKIIFYDNGHLVGAVITLIIISCPGREDITILHTGDYKDKNLFFNVSLPQESARKRKISSFVVESTYGDVDSTNPKFDECLQENTAWAINRGMTVLYPTFALGRHQEALYKIKESQEKELISPDTVIVVVDGKSSQIYNGRFKYSDIGIKKEMRDFMPTNYKLMPRSGNRSFARNEIIKSDVPKIILAPGGMGDYGAVRTYLESYIENENVMVHGLGYAATNSVMYKLLNTPTGEKVNCYGKIFTKKCITMTTSELSSHAPRDISLKLIKEFPYIQSISINHGEINTQGWFRKFLLENLDLRENQIDMCKPEVGVTIEPNGITEIFKTKFAPIY